MRSLLERKRVIKPVQIGDETYYVRSLPLSAILKFSELTKQDKSQANIMASIIRLGVCDADGNEVFTDDDLPALANPEAGAEFMKLSNAALDLSGIGAGKVDEAKKD